MTRIYKKKIKKRIDRINFLNWIGKNISFSKFDWFIDWLESVENEGGNNELLIVKSECNVTLVVIIMHF